MTKFWSFCRLCCVLEDYFLRNYTGKMRTPSLFARCLPGLLPQDRGNNSVSTVLERDVVLPTPAVEILPSKVCFVSLLIVMYHLCLAWIFGEKWSLWLEILKLVMEEGERKLTSKLNHTLFFFFCVDGSSLQVCWRECRIPRP